jgi:hypothetical protein
MYIIKSAANGSSFGLLFVICFVDVGFARIGNSDSRLALLNFSFGGIDRKIFYSGAR